MTVVFLIVFVILRKAGFGAIVKMVTERKAFIDESLKKAHEANEKLANIQKEGESILQEAREKQAAILREAAETRDAIVEKAQNKAREEEQDSSLTPRHRLNLRSRTPFAKSAVRWLNSLFRLLRRCSRLSSLTIRHRWI